jgi:hypothetical protein
LATRGVGADIVLSWRASGSPKLRIATPVGIPAILVRAIAGDVVNTLLDRVRANNAAIAVRIAEVQAAMPGLRREIIKSVMATPGVPEAFARDAVVSARPGGPPVRLETLDQRSRAPISPSGSHSRNA